MHRDPSQPAHPNQASLLPRARRHPLRQLAWRDRVLLPLVLLLLLAYQVRAQAQEGPGAATLIAQSSTSEGYVVMPYVDSEVHIEVTGMVARVRVTQHFFNDTGEWLEGKYLFPLPENAAVDRLKLIIGDRVIEGEIREKGQARREYNAAKRAGKRAGLVEQNRPNLFSTEVANLAPDEHLSVEIAYLQPLDFADGGYSLRYPMTLTPRYTPGLHQPDEPSASNLGQPTESSQSLAAAPLPEQRYHPDTHSADGNLNMTTILVHLNAGMPLDRLESGFHDVEMELSGDNTWWIESDLVPSDRDFVLHWSAATGDMTQATVFREQMGEDTYLMLMVMPPQQVATALQPRELIFVIDTSGSMLGDSLEQARAALLWGLDTLRPEDRFNIVQFNSEAEKLFAQSRRADPGYLAEAQTYVHDLEAEGGTDMSPALALALGDEVPYGYLRQVVFVTDGSVSNEKALFAQIEGQLGSARLFTVGIGSAPNSYFMRKAAQFGRGTFTYIGDSQQVQHEMSNLFAKLEFPVLRDLCVNWSQPVESYPPVIPDLYLGEPVILTTRFRGNIDEVELCGDNGNWSRYLSLNQGHNNPGVASLWARQRIESLTDSLILGADPQQVREQVLETALAHHLVSPYTSLVAVDKTPARSADHKLKRQHIANNLPHGHAVGLPQGASGLPGYLLLAGFGITLLTLGWRMGCSDESALQPVTRGEA